MVNTREVADDIAGAFKNRARRFATASLSIKVVTIIGAVVVGVCTFALTPKGQSWPVSAYIGIGAAISIGLSQFVSALIDKDSSTELELARVAVELVREAERKVEDLRNQFSDFERYETEQERANQLYRAMFLMRDVAETVVNSESRKSAAETMAAMLEAAKRSLSIALGYQMAEHFTLCIYIAENDEKLNRIVLRCVAQERTEKCDITLARKWPIGVGVAGASFARNKEIVVPDLHAAGVESLYASQSKLGDDDRYKSIVAVPIALTGAPDPWGVVVATSDRPEHFHLDTEPGVHTIEAVRALAAMAALAVAVEKGATRP
jgi:hypothetical protein